MTFEGQLYEIGRRLMMGEAGRREELKERFSQELVLSARASISIRTFPESSFPWMWTGEDGICSIRLMSTTMNTALFLTGSMFP